MLLLASHRLLLLLLLLMELLLGQVRLRIWSGLSNLRPRRQAGLLFIYCERQVLTPAGVGLALAALLVSTLAVLSLRASLVQAHQRLRLTAGREIEAFPLPWLADCPLISTPPIYRQGTGGKGWWQDHSSRAHPHLMGGYTTLRGLHYTTIATLLS
jgi:hypothetical protein